MYLSLGNQIYVHNNGLINFILLEKLKSKLFSFNDISLSRTNLSHFQRALATTCGRACHLGLEPVSHVCNMTAVTAIRAQRDQTLAGQPADAAGQGETAALFAVRTPHYVAAGWTEEGYGGSVFFIVWHT